jgi:ribosomal protein S18 acetylase RimI-like enzyme
VQGFSIRPLREKDKAWVVSFMRREWGDSIVVSRGRVHAADALPGFIAERAGKPAGLVTYRIQDEACEIVSLNSLVEGIGIGTALIEAVKAEAAGRCSRLWLITTNDNMHALGFYQKRGFRLVAVHPNALDVSRRLKPSIPLIGFDGIPLRDEIELEMDL